MKASGLSKDNGCWWTQDKGNQKRLTTLSSRNVLGKQRVYSLNAFERESVLCPDADIALRNISQNRPVALGKCRLEAQGCGSTHKARIDRSSHQEGLTRRREATIVLRVLSRVLWLG